MGVLKPLLPLREHPAILRDIHTAISAGLSDIIVVTGHMHEEIESILSGNAPVVRLIRNYRYEDGMFSSVCAGILALDERTDGFFLLPADCCVISAGTLSLLIREFKKAGADVVACPTYKGRRGHPPLIPAFCAGRIISYNGENGLEGFMSTQRTVELETDDPGVLMDMDTPEDYAYMLSYLETAD
jgi:CTP:molybdopterin cytidylyltransferase MocA